MRYKHKALGLDRSTGPESPMGLSEHAATRPHFPQNTQSNPYAFPRVCEREDLGQVSGPSGLTISYPPKRRRLYHMEEANRWPQQRLSPYFWT